MKRLFDIFLSCLLLLVLSIPILLVALMVKITSKGSALYGSDRVGINNSIFKMFKFRTMKTDTPPVGQFLRKTSLDELPQLFNIIKGDMSFVGPRPALFNQDDLVALRKEKGIDSLVPGLTGWAQINGRDELPIPVKVGFDEYYYKNKSFLLDMKIRFLTFFKVMRSEGVEH